MSVFQCVRDGRFESSKEACTEDFRSATDYLTDATWLVKSLLFVRANHLQKKKDKRMDRRSEADAHKLAIHKIKKKQKKKKYKKIELGESY